MSVSIELNRGFKAIIDPCDYDVVKDVKWHVHSKRDLIFYARGLIDGRPTLMHRLILNLRDPKILVDHDDKDGLNNQRYNLRIATNGQNVINCQKRNGCSSSYQGVVWQPGCPKRPWRAQIKFDHKYFYLGSFEIETDAALAYEAAAKKYFGCFFKPVLSTKEK